LLRTGVAKKPDGVGLFGLEFAGERLLVRPMPAAPGDASPQDGTVFDLFDDID
jgi:hypothetical protein